MGFELTDTLSSQQKSPNLTSVSSIPDPLSCTFITQCHTKKMKCFVFNNIRNNLPGCVLHWYLSPNTIYTYIYYWSANALAYTHLLHTSPLGKASDECPQHENRLSLMLSTWTHEPLITTSSLMPLPWMIDDDTRDVSLYTPRLRSGTLRNG